MGFFSKLFRKEDGSSTLFGKLTGGIFGQKTQALTTQSEPKTFWELIGLSSSPFATKDGSPLIDLSNLIKLPEIKVSGKVDEGQAKTFGIGAIVIAAVALFLIFKPKNQSKKSY